MDADGCTMKDLTVLAPKNDPFRLDTPARHRDGRRLADTVAELGLQARRIHLRACTKRCSAWRHRLLRGLIGGTTVIRYAPTVATAPYVPAEQGSRLVTAIHAGHDVQLARARNPAGGATSPSCSCSRAPSERQRHTVHPERLAVAPKRATPCANREPPDLHRPVHRNERPLP
jgi:hypothetical protein